MVQHNLTNKSVEDILATYKLVTQFKHDTKNSIYYY